MGVLTVAIALAVAGAPSLGLCTLARSALFSGAVALDPETRALVVSATVGKLQCHCGLIGPVKGSIEDGLPN